MLDITREEYKPRILDIKTPELLLGKINDGEDDYVELIRCNRRHYILRGWTVEAHYPSRTTAMSNLDQFAVQAAKLYRDAVSEV